MDYYKNKIVLPYTETVGVGANAEPVEKKTYEELKDFLKSDASLKVFSNCHELIAIANLYNIKINIFTYGDGPVRWTQLCPDPQFVSSGEIGKWIPDMAVYYSYNSHYDLLVKDESRIAMVGLVAGQDVCYSSRSGKKPDNSFDCKQVPIKKRKLRKDVSFSENLLVEEVLIDVNEAIDDISEEITLLGSKQSGHRRTAPQEVPENVQHNSVGYKCDQCMVDLESKGLLDAHMETHMKLLVCDSCDEKFVKKTDLDKHIVDKHKKRFLGDEWNCNDCPFQGNISSQLMKHLKLTSHQPSSEIKERRALFLDYKQCYTCKMEFDGFWNLMNHRKSSHPTNKKCRNYPLNCQFKTECWYVHQDDKSEDKSELGVNDAKLMEKFNCNLCEFEFDSKHSLMKHKKDSHIATVQRCEGYASGNCIRSEN